MRYVIGSWVRSELIVSTLLAESLGSGPIGAAVGSGLKLCWLIKYFFSYLLCFIEPPLTRSKPWKLNFKRFQIIPENFILLNFGIEIMTIIVIFTKIVLTALTTGWSNFIPLLDYALPHENIFIAKLAAILIDCPKLRLFIWLVLSLLLSFKSGLATAKLSFVALPIFFY